MKGLEAFYNFINGNKTYAVGVGMIVYGLLGLWLGQHDTDRASNLVMTGLIAITGRSALKKLEK